jgi:hypothetical protein
MQLLALITKQAVIEKSLTHVKVPREPIATGDAKDYDVASLQGGHIDEMCQRVEPSFGFRFHSCNYLQQSW